MAIRANGPLIGAVTVHYVRESADISSPTTQITAAVAFELTVMGHGDTLTWYGDNGFYLDTQGQANWCDSDLSFGGGDNPACRRKRRFRIRAVT